MKKTMKRIVTLALALMMVLSVAVVQSPIEANAASTKKVTANLNYKKAPALKTGNNLVTGKRKEYKCCYAKYTAPKKGTYVITLSNLKGNENPDQNLGNWYINKTNGKYLSAVKVKTNKGKAYCLSGATKLSYEKYYKDKGNGTSVCLFKRTATISLKKGETIYIGSFCTTSKSKYSYTVNIKKK